MSQSTDCDLLIHNATLLTGDDKQPVIRGGAIAAAKGRIVALGPEKDLLAKHRATERIDAEGSVVHAGLIDPHFHVVVTTSRGIFAEDKPRRYNYADWKAELREEDEAASALLSCLELLRQGYTHYVEPGTSFFTDAVAAATAEAGIRASLCDPYLWDRAEVLRNNPLGSDALFARATPSKERAQRLIGSELKRNRDPDALVRGHIGLYGEGTASDELLQAGSALARVNGVAFHQHLLYLPHIAAAETERLGHSPLAHLVQLGILDERSVLVHMNAVSPADRELLRRHRPTVIWCPSQTLALGKATLTTMIQPHLAAEGLPVALGVDAAFEWTGADTPLLAQLSAKYEGIELTPAQLLTLRTKAAARAIHREHDLGSLEVGKRADIVVRGRRTSTASPGIDPLHAAALLDTRGPVEAVYVDGKAVLRKGEPTGFEAARAIRESAQSAARVLARLAA
ncbi:MAG TPA: amidohydrolase family protein [Kiloniellales bacterium]|nr:amidohydrolase family protein [Kiloniellales bacterium]